jgi:hypothetical protein
MAGLRWPRWQAVASVSSDASELELPYRDGRLLPRVYMNHDFLVGLPLFVLLPVTTPPTLVTQLS